MNYEETVNTIADYILLVGFVPAFLFFIDYAIIRPLRGYTPWWESAIGVMFATLSGSLVLLGGIVLLSLFLGADYTGRPIVRAIGYASFTVALTQMFIVYLIERKSAAPVLWTKTKRKESA